MMEGIFDPIQWREGIRAVLIVAGAAGVGIIAHFVLFRVFTRMFSRGEGVGIGERAFRRARRPAAAVLPLLAIQIVLPLVSAVAPGPLFLAIRHLLTLGLIAGFAWLLVAILRSVEDSLGTRFRIDVADNLQARRVHTQVRVLRQALTVLIVIIALGAMLMTFPQVRELGAGLLASAGLAGLVVGFAARPVLENLIAGVQIAITQPIRIDDVVIVEGEWGRIEEFTATYVVVRVWDQRRLIVPLSYFIENPFQNWTRREAEILGTVFLHVDYTVPVDSVRRELHRLLEEDERWDGRAWGLVVTDATERTLQLRALMSAPDAGTAWDLRCGIREKLIAWLKERYPEGLPRIRAELEESPAAGGERA